MIAIVDYDAGNTRNVQKALTYLGFTSELTADSTKIRQAKAVILPGVGAFRPAMQALKERQLIDTLKQVAADQTPMLGICLGMQLLFERSSEYGETAGLGLLPGKVTAIPSTSQLAVPQMGWNQNLRINESKLYATIDQQYTYFANSYYAVCPDSIKVAQVDYGVKVPSLVQQKTLTGMQFHPEKSGEVGLTLLAAFCRQEG